MKRIAIFALLVTFTFCFCLSGCGPSSKSSSASRTIAYNVEQNIKELTATISECEQLNEYDFTPYTWKLLSEELESAKSVLENQSDDGRALSNADASLLKAKNNLAPAVDSKTYTTLDYESCIRKPDVWKGQYVGFAGIVNEAKTDSGYKELTVAMDGTNDKLVQVSYPVDLTDENIIAGDVLAVFGSVYNVVDGKTQGGKSITYPVISATYIEIEK